MCAIESSATLTIDDCMWEISIDVRGTILKTHIIETVLCVTDRNTSETHYTMTHMLYFNAIET